MNELIDFIIDDFYERPLPELLPREVSMPRIAGRANVVVGMRRAGKTWFCFHQMQELLKSGLPKQRLLYINFEDDRLLPFTASEFQLILDAYFRKFPSFKTKECHFFLDEIQRIQGWELFVRRVLDTERISLYLTGSSSKLLSTEIATALRGRSLTTEIFPFSFNEFLRFHGERPNTNQRYGSQKRATLQHMAAKYIDTGGFPEAQSLDAGLRRDVLRNYLDVAIFRDVVERHGVGNIEALRSLIRHAVSAPGGRFSVNRFYNTMRSQGISCTKNNLYDYLDYLMDAFLLYQAPIHARSERVRRVNPRKLYVVDSGIIKAMSVRMTRDDGALLENLVFMHLRRQGFHPDYYITAAGSEVDFVFNTIRDDKPRLVQVCWDLSSPETRKREVDGLFAAMKELGVERGTIVTWLNEADEGAVQIVPAWKWLLSPEGFAT